jgi:hypothetical protein
MEHEEEYRKIKEDAYHYIGEQAHDPVEDDLNDVVDYNAKFTRLKNKLFYPEIEEITDRFNKKYKMLEDRLLNEVSKAVLEAKKRASEMEGFASEVENSVKSVCEKGIRDL